MASDVRITVSGDEVTIRTKLDAGTPSASGKTLVVATTSGFVSVADSDIRVSLNIIKPRK